MFDRKSIRDTRSIDASHGAAESHLLNLFSPNQNMTVRDRVGYAVATGLGAGLMPVAPGTVGALEGVMIYLAIHALHLGQTYSLLALAIINIALFAAGVWASDRTCEVTGLKDPGLIVIDEVSGQLISLTPLAFLPYFSIVGVVLGFFLFRLFDIFKPYPIRKLERLPGGLGVMADDALAGIYAGVLLWASNVIHLI